MSQDTPAARRGLGPWILAAIASFVIGLLLAGFFGWRLAQAVPESPQPVSAPVRIDREGLTIYSSVPIHTISLALRCGVKDALGAKVPMHQPSGQETLRIGSKTWYVLVRSDRAVPAGVYQVSCNPYQGAEFAAGPRASVAGFILLIFGLLGSLVLFTGIAVVLLIVGLVKRRRSGSTTRDPGGPAYPPQGR